MSESPVHHCQFGKGSMSGASGRFSPNRPSCGLLGGDEKKERNDPSKPSPIEFHQVVHPERPEAAVEAEKQKSGQKTTCCDFKQILRHRNLHTFQKGGHVRHSDFVSSPVHSSPVQPDLLHDRRGQCQTSHAEIKQHEL